MAQTTQPPVDLTSSDDEFHYDHACDRLDELLDTVNPDGDTYTSHGQNVGWQNVSGTTTVTLMSGRDLITKLCPNSDWTLTAKLLSENELQLELSHHDSPTGEVHTLIAN
jgi:hypothetical protein